MNKHWMKEKSGARKHIDIYLLTQQDSVGQWTIWSIFFNKTMHSIILNLTIQWTTIVFLFFPFLWKKKEKNLHFFFVRRPNSIHVFNFVVRVQWYTFGLKIYNIYVWSIRWWLHWTANNVGLMIVCRKLEISLSNSLNKHIFYCIPYHSISFYSLDNFFFLFLFFSCLICIYILTTITFIGNRHFCHFGICDVFVWCQK